MAEDTCFANTERIKGKPFSKRIGDDLLERDSCGHVLRSFGHFTASSIASRKRYAKKWADRFFDIRSEKLAQLNRDIKDG